MINVNIRYKGKELSTILPKCNDELRADLKKAGIDLPAEKLKLRSSAKEQYLVGLYTNNPLDDLIIDRLCSLSSNHKYSPKYRQKRTDVI